MDGVPSSSVSNPITTTTLNELLKRVYSPADIQQLLNYTYPVLAKCAAKGSAMLGGSGFFFPVETRGAHGHAYIDQGGDFPDPGQSVQLQAVVLPTVNVGVVKITNLAKAVSSQNAMAFASGFEHNVQGTLASMAWYKEGCFFRDGTGVLTQFNGAVATSAGPHTVDDVNFLRPGMKVDLIDVTDTTRHNSDVVIQSVDWPNKTVTFETAVAAAVDDNDKIFLAGSQESSGALVTREPLGLEAQLLDSGNYLGIDRGSVAPWKANLYTVSDFLDEDIIQRSRVRLTQETGVDLGGLSQSYALLTHPMQAEILFKLAIPRIQYVGAGSIDLLNSTEVKLGNMPIITSHNCPTDKAYLGDWSYSQTLYVPGGELKIDTDHNGAALKWVSNKDVGLVYMREYCQFVNKRPNAFVKLSSLSQMTR